MPPVSEQPISTPVLSAAPSTAIKAIRIFLLALIVIGLGLIATEGLWVPELVSVIIGNQTPTNSASAMQQFTPPAPPVFTWVAASSSTYFTTYIRTLSWADSPTLEVATYIIGTTTETTDYYKDKNQVHFVSYQDTPISKADPATFTVLGFEPSDGPPNESDAYAKDKNYVYHNAQILAGADPVTIVTVSDVPASSGFPGALVLKDKNAIYGIASSSVAFDIPTFASAGGTDFKDKNNVYCVAVGNGTTNVLSGADPATFAAVPDSDYAIDKNSVYTDTLDSNGINVGCHSIQGSDPSTFHILAGNHGQVAADKNNVYLEGQESSLDPGTLVVLNWNYVKDAKSVYYDDPSSASSTYYRAIGWRPITGADANTFSILPSVNQWDVPSYAKDANNVYANGNVLVGADPTTFQTIVNSTHSGIDAQDKNHKYLNGQIVQ